MRNKILTLLLVAIAAIGIAACGSSSSSTSTSASTTPSSGGSTTGGSTTGAKALKVTAASDGSLAWSPTALNAKAGQVTLEIVNPSSTPHNINIEGQTGASNTISGGDTATVTADLKPGTYTYFCNIPGHEDAGMKGTLTVK